MRSLLFSILMCMPLFVVQPGVALANSAEPAGTRINVSATAANEVANDEVVVTFRIEDAGSDAKVLRQHVNRISALITTRLKNEPGLKQKTLSRSLQPEWRYPKNGQRQRTGWKLVQVEQVTSMALDAVPAWLDSIENAGAHLSGLQFRISDATGKRVRAELRKQAVANFRDQAGEMAAALDAKSFRIVRLNTSSRSPRPMMMRSEMAMVAADSAQAPALSAGEGKLTVSVSGEIEVPFRDFPSK